MKPCRWNWKLTTDKGNVELSGPTEGYLLARKDLCLFQHIPALIQNKIVSFKIEGRMRTAEFIVDMVRLYRRALDEYWQDPVNYVTNAAEMDKLWNSRVREFTTAFTFTNSGLSGVDPSGQREPRFFSYAAPEPILTMEQNTDIVTTPESVPELIVHVSDQSSAEAALDNGANVIYLNNQRYIHHSGKMDGAWIRKFIDRAVSQNARVALMLPYVTDERDMTEWKDWLTKVRGIRNLEIGVSNLGSLDMVRKLGFQKIIADFPLNICNSISVDELSTLGTTRVTASTELSTQNLLDFADKCRLPVDVIAQGPVLAMLMEHCVIASSSGASPKDICPMHCRKDHFTMRDMRGQSFPLVCDRRCRNHLFTSTDICILPRLHLLLNKNISGIRIEAQLDSAQTVARIVSIYRNALDSVRNGQYFEVSQSVESLEKATGRKMSDGALKSLINVEELEHA
jgi:putative protease